MSLSISAKITALGGLAYIIYQFYKGLKDSLSQQEQIQKSDLKTLAEIQPSLLKQKSSKNNLLKLYPYYFQPLYKEREIRTAEKYKYQPSNFRLIKKIQNEITKSTNRQKNNRLTWFAKVQPQGIQKYHKIQGFGVVEGDFIDLRIEYQQKRNLNLWDRITNWISQRIYKQDIIIQEMKSITLFMGPVIGKLKYQISLMKGINIVAVCDLQNGKIIPKVTATSKNEIIAYYKRLINEKYLIIGGLTIGAILLARMIWSDIKILINSNSIRLKKSSTKYYNIEQPSEDKMCIICYNSTRNMIFFNCRHMIMCVECSQNYEQDVCPYCKVEIDEVKPVSGIP